MSEQQKILEMIEKGQITAAEGMELLEALNATKATEPIQKGEIVTTAKRNYKFLKVKVTSDNNSVNVNVNIPLRLLTTISEIADKMTTMVPADARKEMEAKGIDISSIDFAKIIEEIINGSLDDPNIVDVEAWDESHNSMVKVRVYVD
jgi:excinuclease UvrABC ATPase subunit